SGRLAGCTDDGSGARECLLFVPRSGYPLLVGALAGLGRFSETSRPDSVPDPVGVIVRVTR
ncbi:MAG: hypothetical protein HYR86_03830, partial [Candidatus Rokubacteria bacterium]|nr:hypothetical protein [Candidatus Rokubacteria bacterium]